MTILSSGSKRTNRAHSSIANYRDRAVYITGGFSDTEKALDSVMKFDLSTREWTDAPAINQARLGHSSCVLGSKLYVFGGRDGERYLNSLEVLNVPSNNLWSIV